MRGGKKFSDFLTVIGDEEIDKIKKLVKGEPNEYFLGVREDYMNIYYKGMSMARIESGKRRKCKYIIHKSYLGDNDKTGYCTIDSENFYHRKNDIKEKINEHVVGNDENQKVKHTYIEKICQQWIINTNNSNPNSEWYYIDMEYVYKSENDKEQNHPYGRADLIAIRRNAVNGVHDVALVELKTGTGAYRASINVPKNEENKEECRNELIEKLKDEDEFWKMEDVKLGSGLASHMVDFLHFLNNDFYRKQVRQEIWNIIQIYKNKFELIEDNNPLYEMERIDDISEKPDIYIVTYSSVPDAIVKIGNSSLNEMKACFARYFYADDKNSKYAVEKMMPEEVFRDFKDDKKKSFFAAGNNDAEIEFTKNLNDDEYKFIFRFIEAHGVEAERCI